MQMLSLVFGNIFKDDSIVGYVVLATIFITYVIVQKRDELLWIYFRLESKKDEGSMKIEKGNWTILLLEVFQIIGSLLISSFIYSMLNPYFDNHNIGNLTSEIEKSLFVMFIVFIIMSIIVGYLEYRFIFKRLERGVKSAIRIVCIGTIIGISFFVYAYGYKVASNIMIWIWTCFFVYFEYNATFYINNPISVNIKLSDGSNESCLYSQFKKGLKHIYIKNYTMQSNLCKVIVIDKDSILTIEYMYPEEATESSQSIGN